MECQESTNNSSSKILILTTNRMTIACCFVLSLSYTKKGRKFCPQLIYQGTDFLSNKIDATYYQGTQQCPTRKWLSVTRFAGTVIILLLYMLF